MLFPPYPESHVVYEIMWENVVEPNRTQVTIYNGADNMRSACQITKARRQIIIDNI